jgi:CRP-like cAMP-binding protein
MLSKDDFRNNDIFSDLNDGMIEKLIPLGRRINVEARDYVFKEGDRVENIFIIKRGTVLIEQRVSEKMTVTAGTVTVGECFGYSSMFEEGTYSTNAVAADPCELIVINGEAMMDVLKDDHTMGFLVLRRIIAVFAKRLSRRTEQFLRAVTSHPEIHDLGS